MNGQWRACDYLFYFVLVEIDYPSSSILLVFKAENNGVILQDFKNRYLRFGGTSTQPTYHLY